MTNTLTRDAAPGARSGLSRRNPSLPSELFDVLAGPLIKLRSHPSFDIDFASLPAEALDDHRRWRVKTLSVLGAHGGGQFAAG